MAETTITTSNNLRKQAWAEKLYRDSQKVLYFKPFMGEGADALVQVKRELDKKQGDKVTFGIVKRLNGIWVQGDNTLEGNEEALTTYDFNIVLDQFRAAVRDNGAMTRKRAAFDVSAEMETGLKVAGAEKMDQMLFDALGVGSGATVDPTIIAYTDSSGNFQNTGTAATAKAGLAATNSKLTLNFLSYIKTIAKTGKNRTFIPIRPIVIDGKSFYVFLTHPDSLYDLKTTSAFQQAMRDAEIRGSDNPIFTGATAIWDGVVIHEHENCAIANDGGGSTVAWNKAALMGAQSLCWAAGEQEELVEETFDYQNKRGVAWKMICQAGKAKFNSQDYGSIGVYVSRSAISA